jgi:prepilin peptidase CpaA
MATPALAAWAFLPFAVPIALWVAWSDMARMKIPNKAVLALAAVFLFVGPFVLPLADWGWRWVHLVVILLAGFVGNAAGLLGAGDAKFAAAMAPFVALADATLFLTLFAAVLIAAFVTHRAIRAVPALRRVAPDWESWGRRDFPMGLALGGVLILYLLLAATR